MLNLRSKLLLMKQLLIVLCIFMNQNLISQNTPQEITKEFIKDYKVWNDNVYQLQNSKNPMMYEIAEKSYKELIQNYCVPNKLYQNLAFGSKASHTPEEESITESKIEQNKAIVKTTFKDIDFDFIINYYEYHFVFLSDKWLLEEVYLVDEEGKYPGL